MKKKQLSINFDIPFKTFWLKTTPEMRAFMRLQWLRHHAYVCKYYRRKIITTTILTEFVLHKYFGSIDYKHILKEFLHIDPHTYTRTDTMYWFEWDEIKNIKHVRNNRVSK
jgi:hypothetical protein